MSIGKYEDMGVYMSNKAQPHEVESALRAEREYQDARWGTQHKSVGEFLTCMRHWLTQAERDATKEKSAFDALNQIRKVTALGYACMEHNGVITREMVP